VCTSAIWHIGMKCYAIFGSMDDSMHGKLTGIMSIWGNCTRGPVLESNVEKCPLF
jgi:hypothetical protein